VSTIPEVILTMEKALKEAQENVEREERDVIRHQMLRDKWMAEVTKLVKVLDALRKAAEL
jgi:hypothetical protein